MKITTPPTTPARVLLERCFEEALKKENPASDFVRTAETQRTSYTNSSLDPRWLKRVPFVIEQKLFISTRDGQSTTELIITRPPDTENTILPVIVYLHGGGWVGGDSATHRRPRTELAIAAHAAVVFVNYSRSPEHKYPIALEECYDTVTWMGNEANAHLIHVDPATLVVIGDSAGGNLTAGVTLLAKQRDFNGICAQVLIYPVTDCNFSNSSYNKYGGGEYDPSRELMEWFFDQYVPDESKRQEITVSPLKASIENLRGLPPALVLTCEADALLDEGEAYAKKLLAAGVKVIAIRLLGTAHGFLDMSYYDSSAAQAGIDQIVSMLHRIWKN
ncbi:hypothetical protein INT45_009154 [Circinella minor]|uniref:Alpha/beta hydrolase fold-3 domain-containing protein n=1 Tax=Circinella minor TaxID=1195481 RepID=A0A8H7SGP4_9FUNG|nr:hypothetical protein INT45_009154 [Circinella minor]